MLVAVQTCRTCAVPMQRHHRYPVTNGPPGYLCSDLSDRSRHLVPRYVGNIDALVHVSADDVQVGATNPAEGNINYYLVGSRSRNFYIDSRYVAVTCVGGCFHEESLRPVHVMRFF